MRAIRGAITVTENTEEQILSATEKLLSEIIQANALQNDDVISVIFSLTQDLDAAFPARAARKLGWDHAALLDVVEIPVPGSLAKCIRVLIYIESNQPQKEMKHIYLGKAKKLRPDLS